MHFSLLAVASFLAIPVLSSGLPDGALEINIKRSYQNIPSLSARDEQAEATPDQKIFYTTNIKVGTPEQDVEVLVDTSSADTVLHSPETKFGGMIGYAPGSTFDSSKSESWKNAGTPFEVRNVVGSSTGKLGTDRVRMGDNTVDDVTIGIASTSNAQHNMLGVGKSAEGQASFLDKLYENGKISSPAFSMSMQEDGSEGSMLLGAVDHSKYTGKLVTLATSSTGSGQHYGVTVNGIRSDGRATQNILSQPMTAVLDSGSKFSYFPVDVTRGLYEVLNANPSFAIQERYYTDCNITNNFIFDLGTTQISVPAYYVLTPIENYVSAQVAAINFPRNSCYVGIITAPGNGNYGVLGQNIIQSSYIVYDNKNKQVAIAQANFDKRAAPEIEVITDAGIPGAVPY